MPPIKFRERLTKFMISISLSEKFCCQNLITCIKVINMTRNSAKSNKLRNTLSLFENRVPLKPVPGGGGGGRRGQCCTITLLHINRLYRTESAIFVSLMCSFLLPEDYHSERTLLDILGNNRLFLSSLHL